MLRAKRIVQGTEKTTWISGFLGKNLTFGEDRTQALNQRSLIFDALQKKKNENLSNLPEQKIIINILTEKPTFSVNGISFKTTPLHIAKNVSKKCLELSVVARVTYKTQHEENSCCVFADIEEDNSASTDGDDPQTNNEKAMSQLWDMHRPLEGDCDIEFLTFESLEGQNVFWHSSAHILGEAIERIFGGYLTVGPPLSRGFYYDAYLGESRHITEEHYKQIEEAVKQIIKENQLFERLVLTKDEALEMFKDNPFKVALISSKIPDHSLTTCYRCGSLVDLCRGPHLTSTSTVKSFMVEKHSAVYWMGNTKNDMLQRLYAISFPTVQRLEEYKKNLEEAKKRDHRNIGQIQNLFFFDTHMSPGSCFWLPNGAKIYNKLIEFIRSEYRYRGFEEVVTPNMFSYDLFRTSGHLHSYRDNMYSLQVEGKDWAFKPMNCPGHCIMFRHINPSYRQLPLRFADFGVLHRNEVSGSLTGLTRVRRFQQDDAHTFCRMDQLHEEVLKALDFACFIYDSLGFKYEMKLATRPEKAIGSIGLWKQAEDALKSGLASSKKEWVINPGDGAFYGPKIDIYLQDALQRWHQCGTIQIDFQLPLRFNLQYKTSEETLATSENNLEEDPKKVALPIQEDEKDKDLVPGSLETPLKPGWERPVIIHRAILGSIERMIALLIEHTSGKLDFWISPKQLFVCSVSEKQILYAKYVCDIFKQRGFFVYLDSSNATLNKKIRTAQLEQWNVIIVVGNQEQEAQTITIRARENPKEQKLLTIAEALKLFRKWSLMPSSVNIENELEIPAFQQTSK